VDLAGALGLLTVAEGVETTDQQDHVAELGCDLAQGYLFSRPVDAETVMALMTRPTLSGLRRPGQGSAEEARPVAELPMP
jgi:EAL domain-containing protein (putative c-di-GMP-specific phosphodiesterase class I)